MPAVESRNTNAPRPGGRGAFGSRRQAALPLEAVEADEVELLFDSDEPEEPEEEPDVELDELPESEEDEDVDAGVVVLLVEVPRESLR
nr:hypothetical protein [Kineosporia sp. NBRC 101677]